MLTSFLFEKIAVLDHMYYFGYSKKDRILFAGRDQINLDILTYKVPDSNLDLSLSQSHSLQFDRNDSNPGKMLGHCLHRQKG